MEVVKQVRPEDRGKRITYRAREWVIVDGPDGEGVIVLTFGTIPSVRHARPNRRNRLTDRRKQE